MNAPVHRKKAKNAFTVGLSPDMRTLNVKLLDFAEVSRPSVQKDIHQAIAAHLRRVQQFSKMPTQGN